MVEDTARALTVDEVAARLNVKRETVYAYVSRGRLNSRRSPDGRGSVFDPVEVDRLIARVGNKVNSGAIESELALIEDGQLYYRGRSARELAVTCSFEEVAELLWGTESGSSESWSPDGSAEPLARKVVKTLPTSMFPVDRLRVIASCIEALTPPLRDAEATVVAATARQVLATMINALPAQSEPSRVGFLPATDRATQPARAEQLDPERGRFVALMWSRLCAHPPTPAALRALNATMVLSADHDLASATYLARMAARAGVDPAGVIRLGLDVGSGPVKGAFGLALEDFLRNLDSPSNVETALTRRLRQGEPIPGFGHAMYPAGDSRASLILELTRELAVDRQRLATVEEVIRTQARRGLPPPNDGFAIAALTYVCDMIPGAGETIFTISRGAGWIAHSIEEYGRPPMTRQRSVYVGLRPQG